MVAPYTIPLTHPNREMAGKTVDLYSRVKHPEHGDLIWATLGDKQVGLKAATNPGALAAWKDYERHMQEMARKMAAGKRDPLEALINEGGEGYGSPRNYAADEDRTPYHKGDDHE